MGDRIDSYKQLRVYRMSIDAAMEIFRLTKRFPVEERYSMVDQIRKSSRSVSSCIAEAWRKRRYRAAFVAKLNDAEGEGSETQVWLELALLCDYISKEESESLDDQYDHIVRQLSRMIENPCQWCFPQPDRSKGTNATNK